MKKLARKILWGAAVLFVTCQFFQPERNLSATTSVPDDFIVKYSVPEPFRKQLQTACYDCHSNNTRYPWYTNVQPIGWWQQSHVNDGKEHLNLSEFGRYSEQRQADKVDAMIDELTFRTMPLKSYTFIHRDARLTKEQSNALADWLLDLRDSMDE